MIKKLAEIAEGWKNLIDRDPEVEKIAEERLGLCLSCKYNNTSPELGMLSKCTLCGCVLEAKSRSLKSKCPINLWPDLTEEAPQ